MTQVYISDCSISDQLQCVLCMQSRLEIVKHQYTTVNLITQVTCTHAACSYIYSCIMNCCIIALYKLHTSTALACNQRVSPSYHCPKPMASNRGGRGRAWEHKEPPQQTLVSTDFSLHAESQRATAQYRLRVCTYITQVCCINVISTYSHCPLAHTTCTLEWGRPHTQCLPCKCRVLTGVGGTTLPSGSHPLGSHPLVVRLSAPESHESQRLLTKGWH